ncbi:MAG: epoxyqueuosine reductase QueH, partial [Clostridia bacterium]|nr:epoxyqueuosine reductase QueH [Clostridia bacterium]
MDNIINYQLQLDQIIKGLDGKKSTLLLHACCAPCSSYCLEYLKDFFDITLFF